VTQLFPFASALRLNCAADVPLEALVETIRRLPNLSELSCADIKWRQKPATDYTFRSPPVPPPAAASIPNLLRVLRIRGTLFVNGSALAPLMVSPAMKYLQLEGCRDLKDADLAAAMQHLHQLHHLDVSDCTSLRRLHLGAAGAQTHVVTLMGNHCVNLNGFAHAMPRLSQVDLQFCTGLSDTALEQLVSLCPSLRRLNLRGCSKLRSPDLHSSSVRTLDLSLCSGLEVDCS